MNSQPINVDPPTRKPEAAKLTRKRETKEVANAAARRKSQQKANTSLEGFLQSVGLEKYLIAFQVEEVDMTTLMHMTDEDLKVLGIPMGPRKKILLALESKG